MPRLRAFGQGWNIGADDLILPMGADAFITGTWYCWLLIPAIIKL